MHPRQESLDINILNFKVKYKKRSMEEILEMLRDEIYCIIGITSTALKLGDIYGVKTFTIYKLFDLGANNRLKKTMMNNSKIKSIENYKDLIKI